MINPKSVALVLFAVAFGFASVNVQADPGDSINVTSAFVDKGSGYTYNFQINAQESPPGLDYPIPEPGVGLAGFLLYGPRLFLFTVGKGGVWGPPLQPGDPPTYPFNPLATIRSAAPPNPPAGNQAVAIDGEIAEISTHAYVHSDCPYINFIGTATVDVIVESERGYITVVIYNPKGKTKLEGNYSHPDGSLTSGNFTSFA